MAQLRTPREVWIDSALQALASAGPQGVRIEVLAERLGVSKGGFYWHFENREQLLREMLDSWEQRMVSDVIAAVESEPDDPRAKLQHLFELASTKGIDMLPAELALRDWALRDADVAARLRRVDTRRMDYLRRLFAPISADEEDVEARSILAFSLFIGSHFVRAEHPGRSRSEVLKLALDHLLKPATSS
jgi:AcrR family transcriptional regulator